MYMTPKVPTSESGTATLGMMVADTLRRNTNITITTSTTVRHQLELHVRHRRADGVGPVGQRS